MSEERYAHLFTPLQIGNVTVRNRIMQTAHAKMFAEHGLETARNRDYQVERAKGGIGLIVAGNRQVHPTAASRRFAVAYLREGIAVDRRMTDAVHEHGARAFLQINHFGVNTIPTADDPRALWAPSAVKSLGYSEVAKAMEPEEIAEVTRWWGRSAAYAREGGFDGVEVHISHTYLLHQFLSPVFNRRTDAYGGSLENRLRFAREVIAEVREQVGRDYVVGVRLTLSDGVPGGLTVADAIEAARLLEADGQIDYVGTTAGGSYDFSLVGSTSDMPDGHLLDDVAALKAAIALPVYAVGGVSAPADAERIVADGRADMVALTRAQIADPAWANKARAGREDEIRRCIRANQGCFSHVPKGLPITCTVNPAVGRERRFGDGTLAPAEQPGRWLVVGGGPAGMKAAETLALRGHAVTLQERGQQLGGQVNLILRTPGRATIGRLTEDLTRQLERLGVELRLGEQATVETVEALAPDGVIVATGALPTRTGATDFVPFVDALPGVEQPHVHSAWDVLRGEVELGAGAKVVLLDDDGSRYAAGVAELLLDAGADVELATPYVQLFPQTTFTVDLPQIYRRLRSKGLRSRAGAWAQAVGERDVALLDLFSGETSSVAADAVVLATSPRADEELYFGLRERGLRAHRVGDCVAPRRLDHAIYEGYLAGRELWSTEDSFLPEGSFEREPADEAAVR